MMHPTLPQKPASREDLIAAAVGSSLCGGHYARHMAAYGEAHDWIFDRRAWLKGKRGSRWAHAWDGTPAIIKMAAGLPLGKLEARALYGRLWLEINFPKKDAEEQGRQNARLFLELMAVAGDKRFAGLSKLFARNLELRRGMKSIGDAVRGWSMGSSYAPATGGVTFHHHPLACPCLDALLEPRL